MSILVEQIEDLIDRIEGSGQKVGDTREVVNATIYLNNMDYERERMEVEKYFKREQMNFEKKAQEEAFHYATLRYGLLHKINYNKFYHKELPINSRKLFVQSDDCISNIHILAREKTLKVNVYMRSSEVKCLLFIDCLGILDIVDTLKFNIYNIKAPLVTQVNVQIGSAHLYLEGDERRKDATLHTGVY